MNDISMLIKDTNVLDNIKNLDNWKCLEDVMFRFYINKYDYFEILFLNNTYTLYIINVFGREFITSRENVCDCLIVAYYTYIQFFDDYHEGISESYETGNHIVYMHCSPEGNKYIGTTGNTLEKRSHKHGTGYRFNKRLYGDIERFGWDNFSHIVLADSLSEKEAYELEREIVTRYKTIDSQKCYNISFGGKGTNGVIPSEDIRKRHSESISGAKNFRYGKHLSAEHREKIRLANTGRIISDETRRKLSEANIGEKNPKYGKHLSEETKRKISLAHTGKKLSEQQINKLRKSHLGKTLTEEHKKKISETSTRKKKVMCVETGIIYNSMVEAKNATGICAQNIGKVCNSYLNTAGGYHWQYVN